MTEGVILIMQKVPEIATMLENCVIASADLQVFERWAHYWQPRIGTSEV